MPTLDSCPPGSRVIVESLAGSNEFLQRLLEFGVFEGELIEVIGHAPLGDPIEVRLGNTRFSLRRREAAGVVVRDVESS